jgi:hypothetical protein
MNRFNGKAIAINADDPEKFQSARMVWAGADLFTIFRSEKRQYQHFAYSQVLHAAEAESGLLSVRGCSGDVSLLVIINHLVIYKGAMAVGIMLPIGRGND